MLKVVLLANWGLGLELLKILHLREDLDVKLVITQYKKNVSDIWYNSVYTFACEKGYKIVKQESLSYDVLREYIAETKIDLMITHAFMKIIPKEVFSAPKYGSINIHPSLLPKYRGPSPAYWVLKNKEKDTGLTCHFIDEGVDTGDIINQSNTIVRPDDTIDSIIEKQKLTLNNLVNDCIKNILDTAFSPKPQNEGLSSYAPRPKLMESS
jgi:methionyl-tRNA formyltransferase